MIRFGRHPTARPDPRTHGRGQAGQSMVEYLIILPTMMLLLLGAVQFGLLYQIKSQLNYATFNAARQGALKNGSKTAIKDAFAAGMTPIFASSPDVEGMLRGRAVGMLEAFNPLATTVEIISPTAAVVDAFAISDPLDKNKKMMPNDNLQYRSTATKTVGSGPSAVTINLQDANLLKIRVTYCAKLVVPVASTVIFSLVHGIEALTTIGGHLFQPASTPTNLSSADKCAELYRAGERIITAASAIDGVLGSDLEPEAAGLVAKLNTILSTNIPFINWNIGGYRIPITAEAVVRMQSPFRK